MAHVCRTLWKLVTPGPAFQIQFLTFAVIDCAPYSFPLIYHSFCLPSHSFGSAAFCFDRGEKGSHHHHLSDQSFQSNCTITHLGLTHTPLQGCLSFRWTIINSGLFMILMLTSITCVKLTFWHDHIRTWSYVKVKVTYTKAARQEKSDY